MWMRRLNKSEALRLETLLLALPPEQQRMRFAYQIPEEGIRRYVANFDWANSVVFGAFSSRGKLIGAIELVPCGEGFEMAVEVHPSHQNRGVAKAMVERAILYTKTVGKRELTLTCLGENKPMKQLARRAGMTMISKHGEVESSLLLEPASASDYFKLGWQDYQAFSGNARALSAWLLKTYFGSLTGRAAPARDKRANKGPSR